MNEKVLMSAFYINELLVRLLPRGEPEPALFTIYYDTLKKLAVEKGLPCSAPLLLNVTF